MYLSELKIDVSHEVGRKWLANLYRVHQRLWMAFPPNGRLDTDPFFLDPWKMPESKNEDRKRDKCNFLFRIERDGIPRILVQSIDPPTWVYAFQNAPYLLRRIKPEVENPRVNKNFDPPIKNGERFCFRLLANMVESKSVEMPTMRKSRPDIHSRKRTERLVLPKPIPAILPDDFKEREVLLSARWDPWRKWLRGKGQDNGFEVVDETNCILRMEQVFTVVNMPSKDKGGSVDRVQDIKKRYNAGLFNGVLICTDPEKLGRTLISGIGSGKAFGFGLLSIAPLS